MRFIAEDLEDVAQELERRAETEDTWAEAAKAAGTKQRAQIRAETLREIAAFVRDTELRPGEVDE